MKSFVWLFVFLIFLLFEAVIPGFFLIWFAAGALAAYLASLAGASLVLQCCVFFLTSAAVFFLFRPLTRKLSQIPAVKTNVESFIGMTVRVVQTIHNEEETGMVVLNGLEWTARSAQEQVVIPEGSYGIVREICGVKLIIEQMTEEDLPDFS